LPFCKNHLVQFLLAVFFKQVPVILNQKGKCALRLVINVNLCMVAEHTPESLKRGTKVFRLIIYIVLIFNDLPSNSR
jgi:uncharacterized membrane protein YqaE (UPF0057 family)